MRYVSDAEHKSSLSNSKDLTRFHKELESSPQAPSEEQLTSADVAQEFNSL